MDARENSGDQTRATPAVDAETVVEGAGAEPGSEEEGGLAPGTRLGRYVVLEEIGQGGMGMVYSAYDPELNRKVALKLLRPKQRERKKTRSRLLQEAQALAKLAHPNVITVYDVGTIGDRVFVAMELVEGTTIKGWLAEKARKWDEVLEVFIPAGRGLAAAHAANLVHRDFKPDNVLIGRDGRVRVMDFGLARPVHTETGSAEEDEEDEEHHEGDDAARGAADEPLLTQTGSIMGTPAYMAPEQHLGKPTDSRSDQFSFCVALYQALYGERPFDGTDGGELCQQKLQAKVREPPASASVPAWVRRIVVRGLQPDAAQRWETMDAMLGELGKDPRVLRRKILSTVGGVAFVAGSVLAIHWVRNQQPKQCRGSEDAFAAVWNDERAQTVRSGLVAVGKPHVETTAEEVTKAVAAYGTAWVEMRAEACEATHVRGEQSTRLLELRNACLQERLDEIDALAGALAQADPAMAARAAAAALGISPLSQCADTEALAAAVDPPEDDATRQTVGELRTELAHVRTLAALGRTGEAVERASAAYARAQTLEYPPVVAEARFRLGEAQAKKGDAEAAEDNLSEAAWAGASVKHDAIAAAGASELVMVVGAQLGRPEEGLSWGRHAEAAFKRIGVAGFGEAKLRHDVGVLYDLAGDREKARASLEQSLQLFEKLTASGLWVAAVWRALGDTYVHEGRNDEADQAFVRAKETTESAVGAAHPEIALALAGRARAAEARGDVPGARTEIEGAISLVESACGEHDLLLVGLVAQLAELHVRAMQWPEAIAAKKRVYTLLLDARGDHPSVARALYDVGTTLASSGAREDARSHLDRALAMWEKTRGKDHPDGAFALTALGELDLSDGKAKDAVERLERALKLRGGRGLDPRLLAHTQFALARALHAEGDRPRAKELATKARDTYSRVKPPDATRASEIDVWLSSLQGGGTSAG